MRQNLVRACNALWAEHQRIHRIHVKILARGDARLERRLMRGSLDDSKYLDQLLDHEERLSRTKQRCVFKLNRYGVKIEKLIDAVMRLGQPASWEVLGDGRRARS